MGKKRIVNGRIVDEPDEAPQQRKETNVSTQQGSSSATQQIWPSQEGNASQPQQRQGGSGGPQTVNFDIGKDIDVYGYPVKVWQALLGVGAAVYFLGPIGLVGAGALFYFSQRNANANANAPRGGPSSAGPSRSQADRSGFSGQPRSLSDVRSDSMQ